MDAVINILTKCRWTRLADWDPGPQKNSPDGNYMRPVFERGAYKVMVGKSWVTVWRLKSPSNIDHMESHPTADLAAVEAAILKAEQPPARSSR